MRRAAAIAVFAAGGLTGAGVMARVRPAVAPETAAVAVTERPADTEAALASVEQAERNYVAALVQYRQMTDGPAGPHPIPQYEIHFVKSALPGVIAMIEASGLRALVHPLTLDDLADHTTLGHWIGEPLELDLTVLDPPGINQGIARFGKSDF